MPTKPEPRGLTSFANPPRKCRLPRAMGDESQEIQQALNQVVQAVEDSLPTMAQFFVETPLLQSRHVQVDIRRDQGTGIYVDLPVIRLHCGHADCGGTRAYDPTTNPLHLHRWQKGHVGNLFISYCCRHCNTTRKTYALRLAIETFGRTAEVFKIGESPAFGDPRPNLIKNVLNDEIEYFERGYRAESSGLGIGAMAYYRRFVESHKNKIISEIRKVAEAQGAKPEVLATLDRALNMNSFERAVDEVKDAIPEGLRYQGGENPLTLLHSALSGRLHKDDDVKCLENAKDIRLVLTDLAERTTQALKNNDELGEAVKRLMKK